jgi:hypothetical protein
MKQRVVGLVLGFVVALTLTTRTVDAQTKTKTTSKVLYHNGPVMMGTPNAHFVWYGCWTCGLSGSNDETQQIVGDFVANFDGSFYARILTGYPGLSGAAPTGGFVYSGSAFGTTYSHGATLTGPAVDQIMKEVMRRCDTE